MADITEFITSKWKDTSYRGCFTGVTTLTNILRKDYPEKNITKKQVIEALHTEPAFVNRIHNKRKFKRRPYDVKDAFHAWTMDLAFMKTVRLFIGFLICVDIGSRRIYTRLITNKRAATMKKLIKQIFEEDCEGFKPNTVITDAGTEFTSLAGFFKKEGIYLKIMRTDIKVSIVERYLGLVKQRLYKSIDALNTTDWPKLLYDIVLAINSTENPAINGLRPIDIKTPFDNKKLEETFDDRKYNQPHWWQQINNQEAYEKQKNKIQIGDLVLVNEKEKDKQKFRKGYQRHVSFFIVTFFIQWL